MIVGRGTRVNRLHVIFGVGSATAAWPLAARAQQPDRVRGIGVLMQIAADDVGRALGKSPSVGGSQSAVVSLGLKADVDVSGLGYRTIEPEQLQRKTQSACRRCLRTRNMTHDAKPT